MDPVDALLEIASLLERERASRYRAKAFRQAAATFQDLPADVQDDPTRLRAAKGIGESTFAVIRQAQAGDVPEYLIELRGDVEPERVSALRGKLRGDLHAHTEWSDGTTSIEVMAAAARAQGHEYQAITDHSPRLRVARGLSVERLREQIPQVRAQSGTDSRCSPASRWTSSKTAPSIRTTPCSLSWMWSSPPCTRSCAWTAGR